MRVATKLAIALFTIGLCAKLSAQQTAVIINLTDQTAYLLEDGRVAFVSPVCIRLDGQQKQIAQKTAKITKGLGINRAPTGCGTQLGEAQ
jgi:hypothetical protein